MSVNDESKFLDYLEGTLSSAERSAFERALAEDAELQADFRAYRRIVEVEKTFAKIGAGPSAAFANNVMRAIEGEPSLYQRWSEAFQRQRAWYVGGVATFATLLIAVRLGMDERPAMVMKEEAAQPTAVLVEPAPAVEQKKALSDDALLKNQPVAEPPAPMQPAFEEMAPELEQQEEGEFAPEMPAVTPQYKRRPSAPAEEYSPQKQAAPKPESKSEMDAAPARRQEETFDLNKSPALKSKARDGAALGADMAGDRSARDFAEITSADERIEVEKEAPGAASGAMESRARKDSESALSREGYGGNQARGNAVPVHGPTPVQLSLRLDPEFANTLRPGMLITILDESGAPQSENARLMTIRPDPSQAGRYLVIVVVERSQREYLGRAARENRLRLKAK